MSTTRDDARFTFSWLALKLLGKGLYSNPWSALSELVANSLDADAKNVYVFVDARDKVRATVEVIDDGKGMSPEDIKLYVRVGFNKREYARSLGSDVAGDVKGRKGIGKLAALFLSQHYFIQTRQAQAETAWELDARDGAVSDDEHPVLKATSQTHATENDSLWSQLATGTRLTLLGVDLSGYGPRAMSSLGSSLANQFLLQEDRKRKIMLLVRSSEHEEPETYAEVSKSIAFGNMSHVLVRQGSAYTLPSELETDPPTLNVPSRELESRLFEYKSVRDPFPELVAEDEALSQLEANIDLAGGTYEGIAFELFGWIGVHATINGDVAKTNDSRFVKNKYYNPAQLRVYVRGKLASDRLLGQLGLTGTYANYIEGELSFDILDHDDLPDIATSSRQDFDETDDRVTLLRSLVRPMVRHLMTQRQSLASDISAEVEKESARRLSESKKSFSELVGRDLESQTHLTERERQSLRLLIVNKIEGDVSPKSTYRVFISHSGNDRVFASFIDELLVDRGATREEIFFTSRPDDAGLALTEVDLSKVIRDCIVEANTLLFFLTSKHFMASEFCMFEGGAGWATRAVGEYLKLNMEFESIPRFLIYGKAEFPILSGDGSDIRLSPDLYQYLVLKVLNPMIEHLNNGRRITGKPEIEPFVLEAFPSRVELKRQKKTHEDFFDPLIREHWTTFVEPEIAQYLENYKLPGHERGQA